MHLLWLRVAAILYAAASVAIFPAVLYSIERWRKICVHLGGLAFFFHFVSAVEMLAAAHRLVPVGAREVESLLGFAVAGLFFLAWWLYDAISLGVFALPVTFFLVFVPSLGLTPYTFPSQGVRTSCTPSLLLRGARIQPARFGLLSCPGASTQGQKKGRRRLVVGSARLASAARHLGTHRARHAALRVPLHDGWPAPWSRSGAGDRARRRLFPRSESPRLLRDVGSL